MSLTTQRVMAWSGLVFVLLLFSGLLIAGWVPPISPGQTAAQVAHTYQTHTNRIRFGSLLIMIGGGVTIPFVAVISAQMQRIEGRMTPLVFTQLIAGAVGVVAVIFSRDGSATTTSGRPCCSYRRRC